MHHYSLELIHTVFPEILIKIFFYVTGEFSQPDGEKPLNPIVKGLIAFFTRLSLAFSHVLDKVT